MKKVLSILFAMTILCMCLIPSNAATPKISVKTVSSASVGDTITVSVNISANSGLAGVEFTIKFNTSEFQLVSDSVSESKLFFATSKIKSGEIKYAGTSVDAISEGGSLLTFKMNVLKTGGKISLVVNDAINENDVFVSVGTSGAIVKCSHANMKWDVVKKATCTETGNKKGVCSCGYASTETITKTEHSYGKWVVEKEATKTEKGLKVAKCSVCGDEKEQAIPLITTTTTETTTETTTFVENTTENTTEKTTNAPTAPIIEKTSTAEIVAKTVAVVLGVEALGLIVFLIGKKKKEKK